MPAYPGALKSPYHTQSAPRHGFVWDYVRYGLIYSYLELNGSTQPVLHNAAGVHQAQQGGGSKLTNTRAIRKIDMGKPRRASCHVGCFHKLDRIAFRQRYGSGVAIKEKIGRTPWTA
jgi:hypothetical protein